jgi:cell division protein FtsW (lipid II flippase)
MIIPPKNFFIAGMLACIPALFSDSDILSFGNVALLLIAFLLFSRYVYARMKKENEVSISGALVLIPMWVAVGAIVAGSVVTGSTDWLGITIFTTIAVAGTIFAIRNTQKKPVQPGAESL